MRPLSIAQGAEVARIQHGRVVERQEVVDAARGQQAAEVRQAGLQAEGDELRAPMPITSPDWPANGLFFAFSRPLAEGWPGSAGRWPKCEDPLSTLHCSILGITSLVTKLSLREEKKNWS